MDDKELEQAINDVRKDEDFMARVARIVERDREILDELAR